VTILAWMLDVQTEHQFVHLTLFAVGFRAGYSTSSDMRHRSGIRSFEGTRRFSQGSVFRSELSQARHRDMALQSGADCMTPVICKMPSNGDLPMLRAVLGDRIPPECIMINPFARGAAKEIRTP
jgi:hypothetical protein